MPKAIQNPVVGQALQRAFGLQGRVSPSLDEIVVPVVSLGELGQNSPPAVAGAQLLCGFAPAGGAGQFSTFRIECPGNILTQIRRLHMRLSNAGAVRIRLVSVGSALGTTAIKAYTDGRLLDQDQSPATVMTYGTSATAIPVSGSAAQLWVGTGNQTFTFEHLVIGSGREGQFGFVEIQSQQDNVSLFLTAEAREYRIV